MNEKQRITFADEAPKVGWIAGLPLTVSPGASDIMAAFQLAFTLMQQITGITTAQGPQQVVIPGEPEYEEELGDSLDLRHLNSLSPLAQAEVLAMHGLKRAGEEPREVDPTTETVKRILEAERAKYQPSDEGEAE